MSYWKKHPNVETDIVSGIHILFFSSLKAFHLRVFYQEKTEPLMFLHCNGYKKQPQKDCRTYLPDGKLSYANSYAVRSLSFDVDEIKNSFNNSAIFADFIKVVNSQSKYNRGGVINAIPLITFHDVDLATNQPYITNVGLFDQLMKYLHDNGFRVLTMANLGYDTASSTLYVQ